MHDLIGRSERPPHFSYVQRKYFFSLPGWAEREVKTLMMPKSKIGFILQLGYFRAAGRFFRINHFSQADLEYVSKRWPTVDKIKNLHDYDSSNYNRHQRMILQGLGFKPFEGEYRDQSLKEAIHLAAKQIKPGLVFGSLAEFIRSHKIELPSYNTLASVIIEAFKQLNARLEFIMETHLTLLSEWN